VTALAWQYPVRAICRATGWPRSTVYDAPAPDADADLRAAIRAVAGEWPTYGYRRVRAELRRAGVVVNAKRVRRLMRAMGLAAAAPKRVPRTTQSGHAFPRFPNLVGGLTPDRPEAVWVADLTYVRVGAGFVYLAVLMDVFTRAIRGWAVGRSLDQSLTLAALDRALADRVPAIHHSDQGVQYAATAYVGRLTTRHVRVSMAAVGCPEENGYAERLIRTIREEEIDLTEYADLADARRQIGRFLADVYNVKRIHSALGDLTPAEYEAAWHAGERL
jgi:putative transposase